jgi:flagellar biosynthesis/type III secretory pathway chaperone
MAISNGLLRELTHVVTYEIQHRLASIPPNHVLQNCIKTRRRILKRRRLSEAR